MSTLPPDETEALRAEHGLSFAFPPKGASPAEAERECNRLLRALASVRAQIAANERAHTDEVQRAGQWLERVNGAPRRQETWLLAMIEAVAAFVPRFDGKKSRDLPHGVIGWRLKPERIVVEDVAAAVAWAEARGLPVERKESVAVADLMREWKAVRPANNATWVPPGCKKVEAEDSFYVESKDVA